MNRQQSSTYYCNRVLGEGAFGQVWECDTPKNEPFAISHPKVALKVIKDPGQESAAEVDILKGLDHKYVKYSKPFSSFIICLFNFVFQQHCEIFGFFPWQNYCRSLHCHGVL